MRSVQTKTKPIAPNADHLATLAQIAGDKAIIAGDAATPHLTEWRKRWQGQAAMVLAPDSVESIAAIVHYCAEHHIAITPQGGNTGLVGGQIPFTHEILLSTKRLRRIRDISPVNQSLTVDAGVTLTDAQEAARSISRFFPLSIGSEGTCQIGGVISTNAGGVNVLRYGNMRDLVLGLEAVLPNGEIWDGLNCLRKNNTGYDLKHLFIGAEGTLGIVTGAVLKLFPEPARQVTSWVGSESAEHIVDLLGLAQAQSGGLVSSFEFIAAPCLDTVLTHIPDTRNPLDTPYPYYALVEFSGGDGLNLDGMAQKALEKALETGLITDAAIAQSDQQRQDFWHLRHSISEALNGEGKGVRLDISVPIANIPAFLEDAHQAVARMAPGARPMPFGHVGDGNVHYDIMPAKGAPATALDDEYDQIEQAVYDVVDRYHGSVSAEHGIGRARIDVSAKRKSDSELAMMQAVKAALDPSGIMNPGKLLPPLSS